MSTTATTRKRDEPVRENSASTSSNLVVVIIGTKSNRIYNFFFLSDTIGGIMFQTFFLRTTLIYYLYKMISHRGCTRKLFASANFNDYPRNGLFFMRKSWLSSLFSKLYRGRFSLCMCVCVFASARAERVSGIFIKYV